MEEKVGKTDDIKVLNFLKDFHIITGFDLVGHIKSGEILNGERVTSFDTPIWLGYPSITEQAQEWVSKAEYLQDDEIRWIDVTITGEDRRFSNIVAFLATHSFGNPLNISTVVKKYHTAKECAEALHEDKLRMKAVPFNLSGSKPQFSYQVEEFPLVILSIVMNQPSEVLLRMMNDIDHYAFIGLYPGHRKKQPVASLSFFGVGPKNETIKIFAHNAEEYTDN